MNKYNCGVLNCGNGKCVHKLLDECCPVCGKQLVEVTTTGFRFCSDGGGAWCCDYEDESRVKQIVSRHIDNVTDERAQK